MNLIKAFWQFSRPHTIFGSIFSVTTLYIIACEGKQLTNYWPLFLLTLFASLACNIFIVGLNQIIDIEVDKINKPYLPLASGVFSIQTGKIIVYISLALTLVLAFATSWFLGVLISIIALIGIAYSVPPIQLKKHHLPAALCITLVRGLLVNIGMLIHFRYAIFNHDITSKLPNYIWPLTIFMIAFSIAIAWFKDLPDTEGDEQYQFKTLAILYSKKTAFIAGSIMVIVAYVYAIIWSYINAINFLMVGCSLFLLLFIIHISTVELSNKISIKRFYIRFWLFFFAMYLLFILWFFVQ